MTPELAAPGPSAPGPFPWSQLVAGVLIGLLALLWVRA